jgi:hypothetical protein
VLNPLGGEGSIVWLDLSMLKLSPFSPAESASISKTIEYINLNSEESLVSSRKFFIESSLLAYNSGKYELDEIKKNMLIKIAQQIKFPLPANIKDWPPTKKVTASTPSSVSVSVTPSATSSSKKPTITEINGINRRASTDEFKNAHIKGITGGTKIPGGVNNTITYH